MRVATRARDNKQCSQADRQLRYPALAAHGRALPIMQHGQLKQVLCSASDEVCRTVAGRDFDYTNVLRQRKLSDSFCCLLLQ